MGARNAGNPHVACDVEGAGDVVWVGTPGPHRRASPRPYRREGRPKAFPTPIARNFDDSRALRGLDHHHIVFTAIFLTTRVFTAGLFMAGVPFQAFAPHGELVAHEFIAELERLQSVGRDGAVAQSDHA